MTNIDVTENERQPPPPIQEILDEVETFSRRFAVVDDIQATATTLWIPHCWVIEAAHTTPYLHITSAEEESGKTRLMEVLQLLVPEPILATDITEAALFRVIDQLQPTLFLDEIDAIFTRASKRDGSKDTFRSLLNAGYRRGGKAYRVGGNGGQQTLDPFNVFGPKVIAGIGNLPRTLASRCIRIEMKRRSEEEPVEDFYPEDLEEEAKEIRKHLEAWASEASADLKGSRPSKIPGLRDRVNEVWRPLLAIATTGGDAWEARARNAAEELAKATAEASWGIQLLTDIRTVILVERDIERIFSSELVDFLKIIEESPWAEEFDGKGAPRKIARLLKPYKILPTTVVVDGQRAKGYKREDFYDAWKRLLPPPPRTSVTPLPAVTYPFQSQTEVTEVTDVTQNPPPPPVGWDG
jgi:hypothetical protein